MLLAGQYRRPTPINPRTSNVGQDGIFYDPSVIDTFRQDNSDTAAVVGQPVGMLIDTWDGAPVLGADIVTNGGFPSATTDWTPANCTLSIVSARLRLTNTSGASQGRAYQSLPTVVGNTYKCTVDLVANANGAQIAVGTSNATTTLFLLTIAAGVTGTYTFYFIATTTTSFIQLRTGVAGVGLTSEWDNVTCKHISGKHSIQQTPGARPILRQTAQGGYWLEPDGVDDFIAGNLFTTLQLPSYLCCATLKKDILGPALFGMFKNSSNYHYLRNQTGLFNGSRLQETTAGAVAVNLRNNSYGIGRFDAIDSLAVVGLLDVNSGRTAPLTVANTWLAGTTLTLCTPGIFTATGTTASVGTNGVMPGLWMNSEPTPEERAGMRTWFNDLCGGD